VNLDQQSTTKSISYSY